MESELDFLQKWYAAQCDGDWEHEFGVAIKTLDNPGWHVRISLFGTKEETAEWKPLKFDNGDDDWISCFVRDKEFSGAGDPSKLGMILDHFRNGKK